MQSINDFVNTLNGYLFHKWVVYALLFCGVLFTIWSVFGQYRALTHGVAVTRGKYDDKHDPGAINHFQALSAALSATVGLGNIAGVAVAVALGGPGAILWMWVIGVVGMALKMTEVTQSMLYRNTDDPENPHGGPMFVVKHGLKGADKKPIAVALALAFSVAIIGLTWASGNSMAIGVGIALSLGLIALAFANHAVLGSVIGGVFVVTLIISAITGGNMFQAWNVAEVTEKYHHVPREVTGIVLVVVVGAVIIGGIKRIGHVAGRIVPFMCIMYFLAGIYVMILHIADIPEMLTLIVKSGLPEFLGGQSADASGAFLGGTFGYAAMWGIKRALFSSEAGQGSSPIAHSAAKTDEPVREGVVAGLEPFIDTLVVCSLTALVILSTGAYNREAEAIFPSAAGIEIVAAPDSTADKPTWTLQTPTLPSKTDDARRILRIAGGSGWDANESVFMIVEADEDSNTGRDRRRISGRVEGNEDDGWTVKWGTLASTIKPFFITDESGAANVGVYGDYAGAAMTAHAFDRAVPGLGKWLVTAAAWLFAVSTMISWSYYGEQGIIYLAGQAAVLPYKIVYCLLIFVSVLPFIKTDADLDMWTTLGLGVMLVANIPIMLVFSSQSMKAYHKYMGKLKRGELAPHEAPPLEDVMEGRDVE